MLFFGGVQAHFQGILKAIQALSEEALDLAPIPQTSGTTAEVAVNRLIRCLIGVVTQQKHAAEDAPRRNRD